MTREFWERFGSLVGVFMAGAVATMNLTTMVYGVPEHYDANVGKIIFALLLAFYFGVSAVQNGKASR